VDYCTLGRSGFRVSRLTLGAMTFGAGTGIWQSIAGLDREQTTRMVALAVERGVNLIDTADAYSQGQSEQRVGEALTALGLDESRMLVATKVRLRTGSGPNDVGLGRSHILRTVETSLKRIGRDHVDLLQLHDRDALVPLAETLRALDDLVRQGKVRHVGACNFSAAQLERAHAITAASHGATNQVHYSLASRDVEHEIAAVAREYAIALMIWSPLAGGYLCGKYSADSTGSSTAAGRRSKLDFPPIDRDRVDPIVHELHAIAQTLEATPAQVALAWLLGREATSTVIVGARNEQQLEDNLRASEIALAPDQRTRLDRIVAAARAVSLLDAAAARPRSRAGMTSKPSRALTGATKQRRVLMYAVTGIRGKVGGVVGRTLLSTGQRVRAVIRNADKGSDLKRTSRADSLTIACSLDSRARSCASLDLGGLQRPRC